MPLLGLVTRKTDLDPTVCSECESLQEQLDAATDSIVKIVNCTLTNPKEKPQELDKVLQVRDHLVRKYLEHMKARSHLIAA